MRALTRLVPGVLALASLALATFTVKQYPLPLDRGGAVVHVNPGTAFNLTITATGSGIDVLQCEARVGYVLAFAGTWNMTGEYRGKMNMTEGYRTDNSVTFFKTVNETIGLYEYAAHCWNANNENHWGTSSGKNGRFAVTYVTNSKLVQWPLPGTVVRANASSPLNFTATLTSNKTAASGQAPGVYCQALVGKVCQWGAGCWDQTLPGLGTLDMEYVGDSSDGLSDVYALLFTPRSNRSGLFEVAMHCSIEGIDKWATELAVYGRFTVDGCGDYILQTGEECDVGAQNVFGCRSNCSCELGHVASPAGEWLGCRLEADLPREPALHWRRRAIYQLLTDRFAPTLAANESSTCLTGVRDYCGGSFAGISRRLSYITAMGFDAIWISPVVANVAKGYHGFWPQNFSQINTNFGTMSDLAKLVKDCHRRGVSVMLDWVANHAGSGSTSDMSTIAVFNSSKFYHNCSSCPSDCNIIDWSYQTEMENCRLSGLHDLDTESSFVREQMVGFVNNIVEQTGIDGLRLDAFRHVPLAYWENFKAKVDNRIFMIGEVFDETTSNLAVYQPPADSLLWFPMYYAMLSGFASQGSLTVLNETLVAARSSFKDATVLGRFLENHDVARFLSVNNDTALYHNALVSTILGQGIPVVYYGTEQGYNGGSSPDNREALWPSGYAEGDMFHFVSSLVSLRKNARAWLHDETVVLAENSTYVFARGDLLVFLRNEGRSASSKQVTIQLPVTGLNSGLYTDALDSAGFDPTSWRLVVSGKSFTITMPSGGEPVVLSRIF